MTALPDPRTVIALIRETAETEILPRFRALAKSDIKTKSHANDLVTPADVESEKRLAAALTRLMPGSVVVGEETAEVDPDVLAVLGTDIPAWIIDPVDGTFNFAHGNENFATIVALSVAGRTLAGWIHLPMEDSTTWAIEGQGAWRDGQAIRVAPAAPLAEMVGTGSRWVRKHAQQRREAGDLDAPSRTVHLGCTGKEYTELARGAVHFAQWQRLKPWDHAAGLLMHAEAGGYSALIEDGQPYRAGPALDPRTILVAPDRESWQRLDRFLNERS